MAKIICLFVALVEEGAKWRLFLFFVPSREVTASHYEPLT